MAKVERMLITKGRRKGQRADTLFQGTLEGGPELAKALAELQELVGAKGRGGSKSAAREALLAGGRIIADAWADRVPVLDGNYQDAMRATDAVKAAGTAKGALGSVAPRRLEGVEDDQQPYLYAARLEFGDADRAAEPSARPAFDATAGAATQEVGDVLHAAIARRWPGA
jgi:hypothetical protein